MATKKMGFEGLIYHGTAGSSAGTQITNATDASYKLDVEEGDTTVRGSGSAVPIETMRVTVRKVEFEWTMVNKTDDTSLAALLTAAFAGTAIAIKTKDHSSGKGMDADCYLKVENGQPLKGEQTYKFTAKPTDDEGRAPSLWTT